MKTVCNENQCTGCMACVDICAKNAIHIVDAIDAFNAVIDEANVLIAVCARKYVNKRMYLNYARQLFGNKVGRMMIKLE